MDLILRDLNALTTARRTGTPLTDAKAQQAAADANVPVPATDPSKKVAAGGDISSALDALRAVVPTTIISLYSTGVILLQSGTQALGGAGRNATQAALAKQFEKDPDGLKTALAALPLETADLVSVRIFVAVVTTLAVFYLAYYKAQPRDEKHKKQKETVVLEPVITTLAFIAWALAAPGTFLAAYLTAMELFVATVAIAFTAAICLAVASQTVLKKAKA